MNRKDTASFLQFSWPSSGSGDDCLRYLACLERLDLYDLEKAAQELTLLFSLNELLVTYVGLFREHATPEWRANLHRIIQEVAKVAGDDLLLVELAKLSVTNLNASVLVAAAAFSHDWAWPRAILDGPLPGNLPAVVYNVIDPQGRCKREWYLLENINCCEPRHTDAQRALAEVMAPEWVGTLPAFCETLIALRPPR